MMDWRTTATAYVFIFEVDTASIFLSLYRSICHFYISFARYLFCSSCQVRPGHRRIDCCQDDHIRGPPRIFSTLVDLRAYRNYQFSTSNPIPNANSNACLCSHSSREGTRWSRPRRSPISCLESYLFSPKSGFCCPISLSILHF